MRLTTFWSTLGTTGIVLVIAVLAGCANLFGGGSSSVTGNIIDGSIELVLQEEQEGDGTILGINGSLQAHDFHFSTLELDGDATWEGEPRDDPDELSGTFTFNGTVDYPISATLGVGEMLDAAVFGTFDKLSDEDPVGFTVEGDLRELWNGATITLEFTDDHPTVADGGKLVLSGTSNGDARLTIESDGDLVFTGEDFNNQTLGIDIFLIFDEVPSEENDEGPKDFGGTVTAFGQPFELPFLMSAGYVFGIIGTVMDDLGAYFDDAEPNPYDDTETYPAGLSVTVDPEEGDPVPFPTTVTILFNNFSPD